MPEQMKQKQTRGLGLPFSALNVLLIVALMLTSGAAFTQLSADEWVYWEGRASQGDVEGLKILAALYLSGSGVKKDIGRAYGYYLQAAGKGDREACIQLRILGEQGVFAAAGVDDTEAVKLCRPDAVVETAQAAVKETWSPAVDLQRSMSSLIDRYSDPETRASVEQMLARNFGLYPYQNNYLLPVSYDFVDKADRKHAEAKFQISVMKPVASGIFGLGGNYFIAYTQQSNWQVYAPSSPFRETNYEPEAFALFTGHRLPLLDAVRFGLNHQSNGQIGEFSRSWNRLFAEGLLHYRQTLVSLKIWYRIPEREKDDDNPDIESWIGKGELNLAWPHKHHFFKLKLRNNLRREDNRSSLQFDWSVPSPLFEHSFFYVQYFNGYGESLIDYNRQVNKLGIGVMWSR